MQLRFIVPSSHCMPQEMALQYRAMRQVEYTTYWAYGHRGRKVDGTLADLVIDMPHLMPWGVIPPLHVLNEYLLTGGDKGGMGPGVTWRPFQITDHEYTELVDVLVQLDTTAARTQHPYVAAPALIVDATFHHCADYLTWVRATSEHYGPRADWLKP